MSFTKKIVMGVFFLVLPALLSGCGGSDEAEQMRKQEIDTHAAEKAKQFQEWQKSGRGGPPAPPSSK